MCRAVLCSLLSSSRSAFQVSHPQQGTSLLLNQVGDYPESPYIQNRYVSMNTGLSLIHFRCVQSSTRRDEGHAIISWPGAGVSCLASVLSALLSSPYHLKRYPEKA
ncbi:hypothetical protein OH77DRAFT_1249180 [Trametes cingulata]|nr:hypothetical protein OH77DRAFT_1249180 [Trametes cingulata]